MIRRTLIRGARLLDPASGLDAPGGLLIEKGRIVDFGPGRFAGEPPPDDAIVIDADGACLAPGLVDTEFTSGWDPAARKRYLERTPLGRLAEPEDVAKAVLAAVTLLPATTGVVIPVDGGRPLG